MPLYVKKEGVYLAIALGGGSAILPIKKPRLLSDGALHEPPRRKDIRLAVYCSVLGKSLNIRSS